MSTNPGFLLLIDSSVGENIVELSFVHESAIAASTQVQFSFGSSQGLLAHFFSLCEQLSTTPSALVGIAVVQSSQKEVRFTISRLIVVLANTLHWSLQVPLSSYAYCPSTQVLWNEYQQGKWQNALIEAAYAKEPTMTLKPSSL